MVPDLDVTMTREEYMALTDVELRELRREEFGGIDRRPPATEDE